MATKDMAESSLLDSLSNCNHLVKCLGCMLLPLAIPGADAQREFAKLGSETARKDALKKQIWIRVKGFGWIDLSH
eukprot:2104182-Ditylum_brightwellii.AAC.1